MRCLKKSIAFCQTALVLMLLIAVPAQAEDISFKAVVDRNTVELGSFVQLNLTLEGAQDLDPIQLPDIDGFASRYLGPSTRISIVNGKTTTSVSYIYNLYPTRTGTLPIPPFLIVYKGQEYQTQSIQVTVVDSDSSPGSVSPQTQEYTALQDKLFLRMSTSRQEVFIHEKVPLTIRLYVSDLRVQNIQYPEFGHAGFTIDDYQEPRRGTELINGRQYQYFEFKTNLYPDQTGSLHLGPAKQICEIAFQGQSRRQRMFGGFWDDDFLGNFFGSIDTRPVSIESNALDIRVKPLPTDGRPDGFSEGVGRYDFEVQVSPRQVKVGDPVTVRMVVRGDGNLERIKMPAYTPQGLPENRFKLYEPDVTLGEGTKFLEQVVIPKNAAVGEIPAVEFSYFDTDQKTYRTIVRGPFEIKVDKLASEEQARVIGLDQGAWPGRQQPEEVGHDILFIKNASGRWQPVHFRLYRQPGFVIAWLVYIVLWFGLWRLHGFRQRLRTDQSYARRLLAPRQARRGLVQAAEYLKRKDQVAFYDAVFKTLQEYVGNKFHLPPGSVTRQNVEKRLSERSRNPAVLDKMQKVFEDCEMVRYASARVDEQAMRNCFRQVQEIIDFFERV